ncbi:phospho-sugar mutase [Moheibacter sediminis]|uniref:Phosphoglucomutase n=1 Tax=Moheibacter sediminis TaxID=1434700 RepID=A0A1W1Z3U7_9FLAO|nr:phospho-sugar mutase [Moheibacter sediminis]SMC42628.1 phosphoglucomutase [Moheibacter sediminis]
MNNAIERAQIWLGSEYDENTRKEVQNLIDTNPTGLEDAFYRNLEFGTGGMRGIMGIGTNRINKYTLGAATQGLANYLKNEFPNKEKSVAIAYDVRHNSELFARIVSDILTGNDIKVHLFESFRPTPELSFAVRHLGCDAGIVLTASHNPPEYNGYKVYWNDGGQIVPPQDTGIISEVMNVKPTEIQFNGNDELLNIIGKEIDDEFIDACVKNASFTDKGKSALSIVFTSIHGTSIATMPEALKRAGFTNVHIVEEQATPSGDFPTVKSPNPEEPEALKMALELAEKVNADIVIGTDPDADRLGIAVRDFDGKMVLLNGNQTNTVLTNYLLNKWSEDGLEGTEFIGSTIVTSDIFFDLAKLYNVECKVGLTGFKWIADMIRKAEGKQKFIGGGEESFGFMVGDFVRDKDSISSTLLACEIAAFAKANDSSFYEELINIYTKTDCYQEGLVSVVKTGKDGAEQIAQMMVDFRNDPPKTFDNSKVIRLDDYQTSVSKDLISGSETPIEIPKSNVLIFYTKDGSKIAARPSGTEPKIKFYFSVKSNLDEIQDYENVKNELLEKIERLKNEF